MPKDFSTQLRKEANPIWQRIFDHPFLTDLRKGTLPLEKFRYYLIQDYLYLEGFARAVALALAKAPNSAALAILSKRITTPLERPHHRNLMSLAQISEEELRSHTISPTNLAYTNHLIRVAALKGLGTTAGALLPCPWMYHQLGDILTEVRHPLYGVWSSFYAEGSLRESVDAWRALLDERAAHASEEELGTIREAFLTSSRYEFLFWEMAYKEESWPL